MSDITDMDRWVLLSDQATYEDAIAVNEAFVAAMNKAVLKGQESAVPGTFVDTSPMIHARRFAPDPHISLCSSPAALCLESGRAGGATDTLK